MNIRRILSTALLAITLALGGGLVNSSSALAATPPANTQLDTQPPTTDNDFMNLGRDLTTCISSSPLPDCGRAPTSSSDRGGWQQLLLFLVMFLGMVVIFWRVFLAIRARDRNLN